MSNRRPLVMHNGRLRKKSGGTEALLGEGDKEKEWMLVYSIATEGFTKSTCDLQSILHTVFEEVES